MHGLRAPVIVAVDLGPCSWRVVRGAMQFARAESRPLRIVHMLPARDLRAQPELEALAVRRLDELVRLAGTEGVEVTPVLLVGEPAAALLGEARRSAAARVVVGSHQRGLGGRIRHGSVSSRLMRSASVPVSCPASGSSATRPARRRAARRAPWGWPTIGPFLGA